MGPIAITIEIDPDRLASVSDATLATYWHLAQANPADGFESKQPGELAERVGWEIIRRWLGGVEPELYHHQGRHYHWKQLTKFARYQSAGPAGSPEGEQGHWVAKDAETGEVSS